jgi:hypothetical protein
MNDATVFATIEAMMRHELTRCLIARGHWWTPHESNAELRSRVRDGFVDRSERHAMCWRAPV